MIKMIVSDFDNTLINYRDGITEYQLDVLRKVKNQGYVFSLVTGRSVSFFSLFPELLEVVDYIISSNGGAIYDVKGNKFLYNCCINGDSLNELISYGVSRNLTFVINELDKVYKYGDLKKIDSIEFNSNNEYVCEQIVYYVKDIELNKVMEFVKDVDGIIVNNINKKNNRYSIDINDINVSKGNGVLWLCDYLNLKSDNVIAFGDGENDISMFKVVNKGVCVENACLELKKYASDITSSCDENGFFKYIEKHFLK